MKIAHLVALSPLVFSGWISLAGQNPAVAPSAGKDEICSVIDPALVRSYNIPLAPDYFFRPFPEDERIAMSSNKRNFFVELDSAKFSVVPGNYDAYPLPGGKNWIYPDGQKGLNFHKLVKGKDGGQIYNDPQMKGYYQSAGRLSSSDSAGDRYRIIVDNGQIMYRDYDLSPAGEIRPVGSAPNQLCPNIINDNDAKTRPFSLPMLSKDGKRMAFMDVKLNHTKIFKLNQDGTCVLERELPFSTGKVDFSYDNKSVAFHTIQRVDVTDLTQNNTWMQTPKAKMVANAWVMDLETGKMKQITHFTDTSALYPAFNGRGEILVRKYKSDGSTILVYDPAKEKRELDSEAFNLNCSNCDEKGNKNFSELIALGQLYSDFCLGELPFTIESKAMFVMSLDKAGCHRLAQTWTSNKAKTIEEIKKSASPALQKSDKLNSLASLAIKDLFQVCPQEVVKGTKNQLEAFVKKNDADLTAVPDPMARCLTCHGAASALPMRFDDVTALKSILLKPSKGDPNVRLLEEMHSRVEARSVPPANELGAKSLTDEEADDVLEWLDAFKRETDPKPVPVVKKPPPPHPVARTHHPVTPQPAPEHHLPASLDRH